MAAPVAVVVAAVTAVEAQLEQSPLLSRRSSVSLSLAARIGRSTKAPTSPGSGLNVSAVAAAAAAVAAATAADSSDLVLPACGSIGGSSASRGSSFGGALPPGPTGWLHQQLQQQQLQQQQQPRPRDQHLLLPHTPSAATAVVTSPEAAVAVAAAADVSAHSITSTQLVSSASFSLGLLGEVCDEATATGGGAGAAAAAATKPPLAHPGPTATAATPAAVGAAAITPFAADAAASPTVGPALALPLGEAVLASTVPTARAAGWAAGGGGNGGGGGGGGLPQRSYASMSIVQPRLPIAGGEGGGGGPQRSYASVSPLPSRLQAAGGLNGVGGNGPEKKVAIAGVRTWLKVLPDGSATIVQLDRAQLGLQYGVQLRDFRVLDPVLGATYPACLLCREGALIVNLDPIKVIITANFTLVNHAESDKARPFIDELKRRLQNYLIIKPPAPPPPPAVMPAAAVAAAATGGLTSDTPVLQLLQPKEREQQQPQQTANGAPMAAAVAATAKDRASVGKGARGGNGGRGGSGSASRVLSMFGLSTTTTTATPSAATAAATQHPAAEAQSRVANVAQSLMSFLPQHVRHGISPAAAGNGVAGGGVGSGAGANDGMPLLPVRLLLIRRQELSASSLRTLGTGGGSNAGEGHQFSEVVASMPFELRALEVVLEQTVGLLDAQTTELERATRIALDELTLRVNPRNLERMRHLKSRMGTLTNKVDTVRGVLEKFLDEDRAMAAMNLTAKEEHLKQQQAAAAAAAMEMEAAGLRQGSGSGAPTSPVRRYPGSAGSQLPPLEWQQQHPSASAMMMMMGPLGGSPQPLLTSTQERLSAQLSGGGAGGVGVGGGGYYDGGGDPGGSGEEEVAVVEMLLEAYFMQLGHTWQRLQSLTAYIASTEDLINLELDQQRNNLISVDLMVTFGSFLLTAMSVIAGLFGMNVTNRLESDYSAFLAICVGSAAAAVTLWLLFVYCSIRYGLMNGLSMTWR